MGIRNSTRRDRMADRETGEDDRARGGPGGSGTGRPTEQPNGEEGTDHQELATILQYLIRSGQVRILSAGSGVQSSDTDDDYYEDGDMECMEPAAEPSADPNPDTTSIATSQFAQEVQQQSGLSRFKKYDTKRCKASLSSLLHKREVGQQFQGSFTSGDCNLISSNYLPNSMNQVARYHQKAFCGTYSKNGNVFLSACQDQNVRIYDTTYGQFRMFKSIRARDVGWSILDTAFSPDGNCLIYSSWSDSIHQCNIYGDHQTHDALPMAPEGGTSFCIFSLAFSMDNCEILSGPSASAVGECLVMNSSQVYSFINHGTTQRCRNFHLCNIYGQHDTHVALPLNPDTSRTAIFSLTFSTDSTEILGGANDGCLYVFNREQNQRTLRIDSHEDDVNAVAFADATSQILFSGGDDGLVKVWDRRTLSDEYPNPVGVLAGHVDGITHIDSKGDARYLISNCKDQCIKLWDMRNFSNSETAQATRREVAKQTWDYRWQQVPRRARRKITGDSSLMTYRGHSVLHTLVRSRFSPQFTTGQRYIYSGCATGAIIIYDALTGQIVKKLKGHRACVRDVSWHPYEHSIISTSWDGLLCQWTYLYQDVEDSDGDMDLSASDDEDETYRGRRRSKRLRQQSNSQGGWRRRFVLS